MANLKGSAMDDAQRISVVLEFDEENDNWLVVGILIDGKGQRRRSTLARFPTRKEASSALETIYSGLPIQMGG